MSVEALSAVLNMNVGDSTRKLVLIGLANHAHKDGTAAYAGVDTLAEYANCSGRTVQRHLAALLETGFIREGDQSVISDKIPARYRPIAYEIAMRPETVDEWREAYTPGLRETSAKHGKAGGERSAQVRRGDNLSPLHGSALDTKDPQVNRGDNLSPLSGVTPVAVRGDTGDVSGVTPMSPKPSSEPPKEPNNLLSDADASDGGGTELTLISEVQTIGHQPSFKDFWAHYPPKRRGGKAEAEKAWKKAIQSATPAVIVAAVQEFAADPWRPGGKNRPNDEGYTPLAATWLNKGRWTAGPYPPHPTGRGRSYNDVETWGTEAERIAHAEANRGRWASMTEQERQAELDRMFGDDDGPVAAHGG